MGGLEKMREKHFTAMKQKSYESERRMLQMMLEMQGELVLKSTFTGWKDLVSMLMQERKVENMKKGMDEERVALRKAHDGGTADVVAPMTKESVRRRVARWETQGRGGGMDIDAETAHSG